LIRSWIACAPAANQLLPDVDPLPLPLIEPDMEPLPETEPLVEFPVSASCSSVVSVASLATSAETSVAKFTSAVPMFARRAVT
jgi:hypothetical protein